MNVWSQRKTQNINKSKSGVKPSRFSHTRNRNRKLTIKYEKDHIKKYVQYVEASQYSKSTIDFGF